VISIGIDVGTTAVKAIAMDPDGAVSGGAFREYDVISGERGLAEQDSAAVWRHTKDVIGSVIAQCEDRRLIRAFSISVQGDAVIPVDRNLKPLHNAVLGMDYRSKKQSAFLAEKFGEKYLYQKTGMRPHPMNSAAKILWFIEERPHVARKTWKYMTYADYMISLLGAEEPVIDYTMASRTMLFSLEEEAWMGEILDAMGLDAAKLSRPAASGTAAGVLGGALMDEWGLTSPVTLVTGGHDQTCAAVGAGVIREHIAVDSCGTAEVIGAAFKRRPLKNVMFESFYPCYCHAVKGMHFTFSLNHTAGMLLKWYRDNFCAEEVREAAGGNVYAVMEKKCSAGPSSVFVLPHFNGSGTPWCDLGSRGAFLGLTMSTGRHDITRGIMDSLAYELKINLGKLCEAGIAANELRAAGGGANSPLWLQIKADVTGCAVSTLRVREAASLGAAILGLLGAGFSTLEEAVKKAVHIDRTFTPNPGMAARYGEKFSIYQKIYGALREINSLMFAEKKNF
jgi:sugar (pentulose or hexulose) kinase